MSFNLAIIDTELRDISGLFVCARLRANLKTRTLPVLISSAWPDIGAKAAEAGALGFVEKPHGFAGLGQRIRQFLDFLPALGATEAAAKAGGPLFGPHYGCVQ
jgi:DNA-binding response OmpR family regulator